MTLPCNEARGERAVNVGGVDLVVAAEYEKLAFISAELKCQNWQALVERISGAEPSAMYAVLATCVVRGDVMAARKVMKPRDGFALAGAMTLAMAHQLSESPSEDASAKNAESAKKAT